MADTDSGLCPALTSGTARRVTYRPRSLFSRESGGASGHAIPSIVLSSAPWCRVSACIVRLLCTGHCAGRGTSLSLFTLYEQPYVVS